MKKKKETIDGVMDVVYKIMNDKEKRMKKAEFRKCMDRGCFNCEHSWMNEYNILECEYFNDVESANVCDLWMKQGRN